MKQLGIAFMVLDIETSTLIEQVSDGRKLPTTTWLSYGFCKLYSVKGVTISKCYFRDWNTLSEYFIEIENKYLGYEVPCYIHNLGYEFDYLIKNLSRPVKMITNSTHNIISATLERYPQIKFLCSYQLSGHSLAKIGEQVGLKKLDSEYRTITPLDTITQEEIDYCERDCDIVAKYVTEVCLKEYGLLRAIPLTKTGRVRLKLKQFYSKLEGEQKWDYMPDEDCYEAMCNSFAGGIVISNPFFTDIPLKNVHSYDETSAYPYALLREEYPYSIYKAKEFDKTSLKEFRFWIAKIKFIGISSKFPWGWLSISKMQDFSKNAKFFNGKLISAEHCTRTICSVDFENITMTYDFMDFEIEEFYPCENFSYMPSPYVDTVIYYSQRKYELKIALSKLEEGTKEHHECSREYMLAKNDFNSIYGMTVQKLVQEEYYIDENFVWHKKDLKYIKKEKKHLKRNFLFGIYITAYSRRNLLRGIVTNCPYSLVYSDTDSIKFIGENKFTDTNERLQEEYLQYPSLAKLGTFEYEGTYENFKTLGAKKYCYTHGERVFLTVAGLPKSKSVEEDYLKSIDEFCCGRTFEDCKLAKRYIFNDTSFLADDFIVSDVVKASTGSYLEKHKISTAGGVALYPTSYKLDMTLNDMMYISYCKDLMPQYLKNHNLEEFVNG